MKLEFLKQSLGTVVEILQQFSQFIDPPPQLSKHIARAEL
jgi:hypothetical protein